MTDFPSYAYGTVTITAAGTVITGTDTIWSGVNARAGDDIKVDGHMVDIVDVIDETHLKIDAWPYDAVTDAEYKIVQRSPLRFVGGVARADLTQLLSTLKAKGLLWYLPEEYDEPDDAKPPLTADDDQGILRISTGQLWVMQGGAWVPAGTFKGVNPRGAWSSAATYVVNDVVSRNGNAYMAVAANTNSAPPSANWMQLGAAGTDATVTVSGTTTGAPGSSASVTSGGTPTNRTLGFTIPRGSVVTVGTTSTGAPGSSAAVNDSGTGGDVVLDFTIPTGKGYGGTSTTSMTIGTGNQTFTTQAGLAYVIGDRVHIGATSDPLNWMEGYVTAYTGTSMTVAVSDFDGSGTFTSWGIGLTGKPGLGDGDMKAAVYDVNGIGGDAFDSANTKFLQSGTGAASRSVQDKLRQFISPLDFGAAADGDFAGGGTDDAAALQKAINATSGRKIDLGGRIYRVDSTLSVPSNIVIENGSIDFSNAASGDKLFEVIGSMGSSKSFSTSLRGYVDFIISDATGIGSGDYLYLESTDPFGAGGVKNGEWAKVKSVASTTVTPYRRLQDSYSTTPLFYKPTLKENVVFRNLRLKGRGTGYAQYAIEVNTARNVTIENVNSEHFADRHFQIVRAIDVHVSNCTVAHASTPGLAYGVAVGSGCERITVSTLSARDMRHGVTVGGESGVSRYITINGCTITDTTDAGIDCHPQAQYVVINGNAIGNDSTTATMDGVMVQCSNAIVTNNVIQGFSRAGIFLQPATLRTTGWEDDHPVISNNQISHPIGSGPAYGVVVQNLRAAADLGAVVSSNSIDLRAVSASEGIRVETTVTGSNNKGVSLIGNQIRAGSYGVMINSVSGKTIEDVVITGNQVWTSSTTVACVELKAAVSSELFCVVVTGNRARGGVYSVRNTLGSRVLADGNILLNFVTGATNGTITAGTNIIS